jgi:hypothetical protein
MHIGATSIAILLFVSGVALIVATNFVGFVMLEEVNGRRPPDQQYPLMFMPFFTVWAEHERLFPQSRRRLQFIFLFLAALVCGLAAVFIGAFADTRHLTPSLP